MTPEEFADEMRALAKKFKDHDDMRHLMMYALMCVVLRQYGYDEGIEVFQKSKRLYG